MNAICLFSSLPLSPSFYRRGPVANWTESPQQSGGFRAQAAAVGYAEARFRDRSEHLRKYCDDKLLASLHSQSFTVLV